MFKFGKNSNGGSASTKSGAEAVYDRLLAAAATPDGSDDISAPHLVALAEGLGVHEDDIILYVIAWKVDARSEPCHITRSEWISGMQRMRLDSMEKLKAAIPALRKEIQSPSAFREFYYFVFEWLRETIQARSIPNDTACVMWPLLFGHASFPNLQLWLKFIAEVYKKAISKDLWQQTLAFSSISLDSYDPSGSWPSAMDEFVDWTKRQKGE